VWRHGETRERSVKPIFLLWKASSSLTVPVSGVHGGFSCSPPCSLEVVGRIGFSVCIHLSSCPHPSPTIISTTRFLLSPIPIHPPSPQITTLFLPLLGAPALSRCRVVSSSLSTRDQSLRWQWLPLFHPPVSGEHASAPSSRRMQRLGSGAVVWAERWQSSMKAWRVALAALATSAVPNTAPSAISYCLHNGLTTALDSTLPRLSKAFSASAARGLLARDPDALSAEAHVDRSRPCSPRAMDISILRHCSRLHC
jgi:hypothetical protein